MRVLLINVNGVGGSTGKIVTDIRKSLIRHGHDCTIAYGANATVNQEGYFRIISDNQRKANAAVTRLTGILYGFFPFGGTRRLKKFIESWKPDIVNLHCANGYIINLFGILEYFAEQGIKTVLTNHAEFYYTGGCGHAYDCDKWHSGCHGYCREIKSILPVSPAAFIWKRFKACFEKFSSNNLYVTSVSPWVMERAKQSPALERFRHSVVFNGLDTSVFRPVSASEEIRNRLPATKPIVLHVTAQFTTKPTNKGGNWIVDLAERLPEVNIVVAATYIGEINALPNNIIVWGRTDTQHQLAELYSFADVTVISSYRETFSMVLAESLCCGTPVVGFEAGGPESIALKGCTTFVPHGNIKALAQAVTETLKVPVEPDKISSAARGIYSKEKMTEEYLKIYNEILD